MRAKILSAFEMTATVNGKPTKHTGWQATTGWQEMTEKSMADAEKAGNKVMREPDPNEKPPVDMVGVPRAVLKEFAAKQAVVITDAMTEEEVKESLAVATKSEPEKP